MKYYPYVKSMIWSDFQICINVPLNFCLDVLVMYIKNDLIRKISARPFFVFQKSFLWGKSKWSAAYLQYILIALSLTYNKSKLYWPLLLDVLGNMYITIVFFLDCYVINFEINPTFIIKPFLYMIKSQDKHLEYLENKKSFWGEIKSIFYHF